MNLSSEELDKLEEQNRKDCPNGWYLPIFELIAQARRANELEHWNQEAQSLNGLLEMRVNELEDQLAVAVEMLNRLANTFQIDPTLHFEIHALVKNLPQAANNYRNSVIDECIGVVERQAPSNISCDEALQTLKRSE